MAYQIESNSSLSVKLRCPGCTILFSKLIGIVVFTENGKSKQSSVTFSVPDVTDILVHIAETHPELVDQNDADGLPDTDTVGMVE